MLKETPNLRRRVEDDPCFPLYGEIIRMLEKDMSVEQAINLHITNNRFAGLITTHDHELWHLVLAMAELKMGRPLNNLNFGYDNNGIAEFIVNFMQLSYDELASSKLSLDAYKQSFRAKIKHFLAEGGEFSRKVDAFRDGSSVYRLNDIFALKSMAQAQRPPLSYYEYLLDPSLKDLENNKPAGQNTADDVLHVMDKEDLEKLFDIMLPVIEHLIDQYHKNMNRFRFRKPKTFCEVRNNTINGLKIRDLWHLMPNTNTQPIYGLEL